MYSRTVVVADVKPVRHGNGLRRIDGGQRSRGNHTIGFLAQPFGQNEIKSCFG